MVRKPDATMQPAPQDNQLMSKHRVLSLKPQLRLERRGQDGQSETKQPDHSASLGDSITASTRIRFSVHTGEDCCDQLREVESRRHDVVVLEIVLEIDADLLPKYAAQLGLKLAVFEHEAADLAVEIALVAAPAADVGQRIFHPRAALLACPYFFVAGHGHAFVSAFGNTIAGSPSRSAGLSARYLQNTSVTCSRVARSGLQYPTTRSKAKSTSASLFGMSLFQWRMLSIAVAPWAAMSSRPAT